MTGSLWYEVKVPRTRVIKDENDQESLAGSANERGQEDTIEPHIESIDCTSTQVTVTPFAQHIISQ